MNRAIRVEYRYSDAFLSVAIVYRDVWDIIRRSRSPRLSRLRVVSRLESLYLEFTSSWKVS